MNQNYYLCALAMCSLLNSCLHVNWTVCLDISRWTLWLLICVNALLLLLLLWQNEIKIWKGWIKLFFASFFSFFRVLSFHIEYSQSVWPSNENFPHFTQCVRFIPFFVLPSKIAFYKLFVQPSFGNLILMRQLQGGLLQCVPLRLCTVALTQWVSTIYLAKQSLLICYMRILLLTNWISRFKFKSTELPNKHLHLKFTRT